MEFLRKIKEKICGQNNGLNCIKVKVADVKVAKAGLVTLQGCEIIGTPLCLKYYLLVREVNGKYYDIFSNVHIGMYIKGFRVLDTLLIEELEPLTNFFEISNEKYVESQELFDMLLYLNIDERVSGLKKFLN